LGPRDLVSLMIPGIHCINTFILAICFKCAQKKPLLIRIDRNFGHGQQKPIFKLVKEMSDIYTFIAHNTGATWRDVVD